MSETPGSLSELSPQETAELIAGGAQVIDVRREYEWEGGRIEGARNIEINDLPAEADSIARDSAVVFYCRTGNRSAMAAQAFREAGYDAHHIGGGIAAWHSEDRPLVPEGGEVVTPLPAS